MRLSGFVVGSILFLAATLVPSNVSNASSVTNSGGSSSSGGSHGSFSGGSSGGTSVASHSYVSHTSAGATKSGAASSIHPGAKNVGQEKTAGRSLLHPFRKPKPIESAKANFWQPCVNRPCEICPPGESHAGGRCVMVSNVCRFGLVGTGYCSVPYMQYWFNDCRMLADELAGERERLQADSYADSFHYEMLMQEYEQCLYRYGLEPFAAYGFNNGFDAFAFGDSSLLIAP